MRLWYVEHCKNESVAVPLAARKRMICLSCTTSVYRRKRKQFARGRRREKREGRWSAARFWIRPALDAADWSLVHFGLRSIGAAFCLPYGRLSGSLAKGMTTHNLSYGPNRNLRREVRTRHNTDDCQSSATGAYS